LASVLALPILMQLRSRKAHPVLTLRLGRRTGRLLLANLRQQRPYQPGFGAAQRTSILKDLARLATAPADHRFMFVIDPETYQTLCGRSFASKAPGVEIVDLITGDNFVCQLP
jgi:hypothetical protein